MLDCELQLYSKVKNTKLPSINVMKPTRESLKQENKFAVTYVSDIHLDYRIDSNNKKATKESKSTTITKIINSIVHDLDEVGSEILLIAGDLTNDIELAKAFFEELVRNTRPQLHIFYILGNHELSSFSSLDTTKQHPVDFVVSKWKRGLQNKKIHIIHNELISLKWVESTVHEEFRDHKVSRMSASELLMAPDEYIQEFVNNSLLVILGGVGFTGYSPDFTAANGLYGQLMSSYDDDLLSTKKFETIYHRIKKVLHTYQVIVLTHTPKTYWSVDEYCKNWIYVNGHTHRNTFMTDSMQTVYADNQIGYSSRRVGLKWFTWSKQYDYFGNFPDGINYISKLDYIRFYVGLGERVRYSRENTNIIMLKNNGLYMFVQQYKKTGSLCILDGGNDKKLQNTELDYYYQNLKNFASAIKSIIDEYSYKLNDISKFIQSFGGSGRVHGCIVDIDFYSHIFLNPFDGRATPYYATDMINKYVYSSLNGLLSTHSKDLYLSYKKMNLESLPVHSGILLTDASQHPVSTLYTDTGMYSFSRIIKSYQYITRMNVIRKWDDSILKRPMITFNDLIPLTTIE